ncbi:MAG TPA: hypothetical protein VE133_07580 [Candidatus Sulfotelmatobacter sp.]|nr:hypothetical protein [Candidatus Sulfotelmatobacter sp.]
MRKPTFVMIALAFLGLAGCSVTTHEKDNGKKNDVDIRTPFGSLSVREGHTDVKDTGLALYPGARPRKDSDDEHHSANVDISSSLFGLKVVALKFESDDSPDKVLAFYRKEMGKYGKVVDCTGGFNMNFHHRDKDAEVTCDGHESGHEYREELKVGTENNQRVLAVKPAGNGSEFALVYVRAWEHKDTM